MELTERLRHASAETFVAAAAQRIRTPVVQVFLLRVVAHPPAGRAPQTLTAAPDIDVLSNRRGRFPALPHAMTFLTRTQCLLAGRLWRWRLLDSSGSGL